VILDIMPLDEKILGFSNRWYRAAMETAVWRRLTGELQIRLVTPLLFLATKLEAFKDRGKRDYFGSRDLKDFIFVVDGRATLAGELLAAKPELRAYIAMRQPVYWLRQVLSTLCPDFCHQIPPVSSESLWCCSA
jgi:hypothetical protein